MTRSPVDFCAATEANRTQHYTQARCTLLEHYMTLLQMSSVCVDDYILVATMENKTIMLSKINLFNEFWRMVTSDNNCGTSVTYSWASLVNQSGWWSHWLYRWVWHTSIILSVAKSLFTPLDHTIHGNPAFVPLPHNCKVHDAFLDLQFLY